jgi:energy-converting hydrogenase B subunit D
MSILLVIALLLVAITGTAVIIVHNTVRQAILLGLFGFLLAVLFILFHAPDVAMAQAVVGGIIIPLLVLLAISKTRGTDK